MRRLAIIAAMLGVVATPAFARSQREGFNFGVSLRSLNDTSSQSIENGSQRQSTSTVAASPFAAFVIGDYFDIGLSIASERITTVVSTTQNGQVFTNTLDQQLRGASPFVRLLFAKYMFLELSGGVYQSVVKNTRASIVGDGNYTGSQETTTHSGNGYGYGAGGGLEIPVGLGWYVTTSMFVRQIQMNEVVTQNDSNRLDSAKTELQFGFTQYLQ